MVTSPVEYTLIFSFLIFFYIFSHSWWTKFKSKC